MKQNKKKKDVYLLCLRKIKTKKEKQIKIEEHKSLHRFFFKASILLGFLATLEASFLISQVSLKSEYTHLTHPNN